MTPPRRAPGYALLVLLFLVVTNRWLGWEGGIEAMQAGDVRAYEQMALAAPGLVTTAILVFIFAWNEFLFALTFTASEASRTIPVAIALFPGVHTVPWWDIPAACVVVTLPLVVLVLLFQRRIVAGLTAGAVKG